jgi:hypothetical protein
VRADAQVTIHPFIKGMAGIACQVPARLQERVVFQDEFLGIDSS